ncbi:MAG: hypothetical protein ASARMPREDX12_000123 [Alectoria sarmentosa]|nr:MAG: hypothetical protein ASARMPREDX12_000123 [Alectoria sarmentosa]
MVQQRFVSDLGPCRPTGVPSNTIIDSSNNDQNRTQRLLVTEGDPNAASIPSWQALMDHIQACEISWRLDSGEVFHVTRMHPEPRQVHTEDLLTPRHSHSSINAVEGFDREDVLSESGQTRGMPRAGRHRPRRTPKRKRRSSNSPSPAVRTKRRPVKNRRVAINSGYDSESEDEPDELEGAETEMQWMRVADVHLHYYDIAFRSINQLACKDIAKAWIRICHPKKQTTHPYNGGGRSDVPRSIAEYGYLGHFTKPDYWSRDEDWQAERLLLLVHLVRSQDKGFRDGDFSLDKMKQSTQGIHLEFEKHWTPRHVDRLKEIYYVRGKEMQYERGQIDGDTLVPVQMPKPRSKVRKAPKSAVKAATEPSEQVKEEAEETSSTTFNVPIANMGINVQIEDRDRSLSEGSEPYTLADTSSSTVEVAPGASCPEPIACEVGTIQHGLPLFGSPSPRDRCHSSAQEDWTLRSADLGRGHQTVTQPNPFGSVAIPGDAQRSLPLRGRERVGSSWMQSFPGQEFPYCECETAGRRVANAMLPTQIISRKPPARPVAPTVGEIRHPTFAASSSGLVGAFSTGADYSRGQTNDLWNAQWEPSTYTAVADPSVSLLSSTNGSFSSGYSDAIFSNGLRMDSWNDGNPARMPPSHQGLDGELQHRLNLEANGVPGYQLLDMNMPCSGNADLAHQLLYTTDFRPHTSLGTEQKFDPFSLDQRQL